MNNQYVALLDSGIGGISLLLELAEKLPDERFLYFGDNFNAPYGNRTEYDLLSLSLKNIDRIMTYGVKALVLACNTLSATVFDKLEYYAGVKTFGVFPPVESLLVRGESTRLLCTPRTAEKYARVNGLEISALPHLAADIEKNMFALEKVDVEEHLNDALSRGAKNVCGGCKTNGETIVLGCTHYFFVKNKIFDHFQPKKIVSGNEYTVSEMLKSFENNIIQKNTGENGIKFIGENASLNSDFYNKVVSVCQNKNKKLKK